jgi:hypothetical protein
MELLVVNLVGKVRRVKEGGREYLVAPVVLIVPGILNGSRGPLLYPEDEVAKSPGLWNKTPITVGHPKNSAGEFVSAHHSEIKPHWIGELRNDHFEKSKDGKIGRRRAEGWFDVQATKREDVRIIAALEAGRPLELSTGLGTLNEDNKTGATHNGQPYNAVARGYKPDHLAILLDNIGACSNRDGCGVLVNQQLPASHGRFFQNLYTLLDMVPVPGGSKESVTQVDQTAFARTILADNAGDGTPSDNLDMDPEKACQILKDGSVKGQPLTEAQRGMFGALCSQAKDTSNEDKSYDQLIGRVAESFRQDHPTKYDPSNGSMLPGCYLREVYDSYVIYSEGGDLYRQDYSVDSSTDEITFSDTVEPVRQVVTYEVTGDSESAQNVNRTQARDPDSGKYSKEGIITFKHSVRSGSSHLNEPDQRGAWTEKPKEEDKDATDKHAVDKLFTNSSGDSAMAKMTDQEREVIVNSLVANCGCNNGLSMPWKGKDATALKQLDDSTLMAFDAVRKSLPPANNQQATQQPNPGQTQTSQGNPQNNPVLALLTQQQQQNRPKSMSEALELFGTSEDKAVWNAAMTMHTQQKAALIQLLVNGIPEGDQRNQAIAVYAAVPYEQLQILAAGVPKQVQQAQNQQNLLPNFLGLVGAPVGQGQVVTEKPLAAPVYNFAHPGAKKGQSIPAAKA